MPVTGMECCFPLVTFPYPYLMIGITSVDFREDDRAVKPVEEFVNKRERVTVLDCKGI